MKPATAIQVPHRRRGEVDGSESGAVLLGLLALTAIAALGAIALARAIGEEHGQADLEARARRLQDDRLTRRDLDPASVTMDRLVQCRRRILSHVLTTRPPTWQPRSRETLTDFDAAATATPRRRIKAVRATNRDILRAAPDADAAPLRTLAEVTPRTLRALATPGASADRHWLRYRTALVEALLHLEDPEAMRAQAALDGILSPLRSGGPRAIAKFLDRIGARPVEHLDGFRRPLWIAEQDDGWVVGSSGRDALRGGQDDQTIPLGRSGD